MEFSEVIRQRYSVRSYRPDPVPEDKLSRLLEAARLAPSASNLQPFKIMVISTKGREAELRHIYARDWFVQAPLVICLVAMPTIAWERRDGKNYAEVDAAIAMDHLILAAANEGLGTCWVGAFDPLAAREVLALPDDAEAIAFTPLGYPADSPRPKRRKSLKELVSYESWSG
ncbi:MAG TPA: nitroreductase family protein [Candidatus Saccharicenans sp.]|jgi:nitroreductase|nr:nitroreductase family protein [Candidatus Saccharicenans sp.]HRD01798.1 nitroreductase family protein [Candidatus Saccharicenans sp.]